MPYKGADGDWHWREAEILELYDRLEKLEEEAKKK